MGGGLDNRRAVGSWIDPCPWRDGGFNSPNGLTRCGWCNGKEGWVFASAHLCVFAAMHARDK